MRLPSILSTVPLNKQNALSLSLKVLLVFNFYTIQLIDSEFSLKATL